MENMWPLVYFAAHFMKTFFLAVRRRGCTATEYHPNTLIFQLRKLYILENFLVVVKIIEPNQFTVPTPKHNWTQMK